MKNKNIFLKPIFYITILMITFLSTIINVNAEILSANSIAEQFENTPTIKKVSSFGEKATAKINTDNKTIDIYAANKKIMSFTYGNDYIMYSEKPGDDGPGYITGMLCIQGIVEAVLIQSGYEDSKLPVEVSEYEKYGIEFNIEYKDEIVDSGPNSSESVLTIWIENFKISLDKDKNLSFLNNPSKEEIKEENPKQDEIINLIPTVEAENITDNSVTIYATVDYEIDYEDNEIDAIYCNIYRSESIDGIYEKVKFRDYGTAVYINCLYGVGFTDTGLKSDTTYYYKAKVADGKNFSEPISITTKIAQTNTEDDKTNSEEKNNTDNNEEIVEYSEPNIILPMAIIMIVIIGCSIAIVYLKKKEKNKVTKTSQ